MDEKLKHQLAINGLKYKRSLRRIIQKYSNLPYQDMAIEVDLDNTSTEALMLYMTLSKKQIKAMESESLLDSRGDLLQLHNSSSTSQLDRTQQDGGHDDAVSCQMSSDDDDDGVSNVHSHQSSLNGRQSDFPETDVLPEDQDEELELSLRSQGSTLSELYPSMIDRIGRAQHRWHISKTANGVLRKYCKWRRQSGRGSHVNSVVTSNRQTSRKKKTTNPGSAFTSQQYSPSREQSVLAMDLSASPESPKLKWIELNETFTVGEQPSTPRRFSVSATGRTPSVCVLSPSLFPQSSSEASLDMLLRSRRLMGEQPSSCFLSPSQSSGASSGVSLDPPLGSRKLFFPVARDQRSSGTPSPPRSSDHSTGKSFDLSLDSERLSCAAAKEQPSLWLFSPSRSSDPTLDQSLRSKRLCSAATGEVPSSLVLSPSKSSSPSPDQSLLRSKRIFTAAAVEQPVSWVLSPSRSSGPNSDQSLRSKRLCSAATGEVPSSLVLSPSKSSSPSSGQTLRAKRLFNAATREQPSSWVLSPSRPPGRPTSDLSLRSKRFALASAQEQHQTSSWVLSPSRSVGLSSDLSLRSKRLATSAADEQQQLSSEVPSSLQSSGPSSDLSHSSKSLFFSAGVASESTEFKERPDIYGSPVRQSPLKAGMVNWEGLRRSDRSFSRSPNSAHVLGYSRPSASPLRKLLRDPKSRSGSPPRARNNLCRHFSFDFSSTTECTTYSKKDLEDNYEKHYHKFMCQSKPSNGLPGRMCVGCDKACRDHSSQTLVALALSPHRFELRKRHRELDRENLSHSKRWSPYSPGSNRHTNKMLRRRLCLPDAEVSRRDDFKQSEFRGYSGRPLLQDSIRGRGLPEECFLGSPGEENEVTSY
ncbi:serine/arginine repetitive matrix protein 2 isoform X2 [Hippocampus comes]|uniref:serine/arginine repetitive matrix protein 2 isoform X2 n=1 Tax=Hippocampus comes TaxID=109280 RepID=UPI00094E9E01|nr:PREDICTED: serine/arginine repetitive matrix protein 2-like isoform X2 [Hippocampus comes]